MKFQILTKQTNTPIFTGDLVEATHHNNIRLAVYTNNNKILNTTEFEEFKTCSNANTSVGYNFYLSFNTEGIDSKYYWKISTY